MWALEKRSNWVDIIENFNIKNAMSALPFDSLFVVNEATWIRGNRFKIVKRRRRSDVCRYFFAERVVGKWNTLTQKVVNQCSLNGFKNYLEKDSRREDEFWMDISSPSPRALHMLQRLVRPNLLNDQVNGCNTIFCQYISLVVVIMMQLSSIKMLIIL